jgi:hypothetical protein
MKLFIAMVFFMGALFAYDGQKQILLGSYLIEENGKKALDAAQEYVDSEPKLKELFSKYSLEVVVTKISGYTVVTVHHFDNYTNLLEILKRLQEKYVDAYALHYPTMAFRNEITLEEVEQKAKEEQLLLEASEDENVEVSEEKKVLTPKEEVKKATEEVKTEISMEKILEEKISKEILETNIVETSKSIKDIISEEEQESANLVYYYIFGALGMLLLAYGIVLVYSKIVLKKKEND